MNKYSHSYSDSGRANVTEEKERGGEKDRGKERWREKARNKNGRKIIINGQTNHFRSLDAIMTQQE